MTGMHRLADPLLMERVATGDTLAFEVLYSRHSALAYGYALRMLSDREAAADIVQDAFLALWGRAGAYDTARGSVRSWLLSIVHHRAIDHARARQRYAEHDWAEAMDSLLPRGDDAQQLAFRRLAAREVRTALARLGPNERRCIQLAYFGGLTYSEVAAALGVPTGTVKSRIRLGLGKLRTQLHASRTWDGDARRGA